MKASPSNTDFADIKLYFQGEGLYFVGVCFLLLVFLFLLILRLNLDDSFFVKDKDEHIFISARRSKVVTLSLQIYSDSMDSSVVTPVK